MKNLIFKYTLTLLALVAVLTLPFSCIPEEESQVAGKGQNFFRVPSGTFSLVAFDAEPQTRTVLEIFRDANSNAELSKSASIDFELSQELLDAYNEEHETEFEILGDQFYDFNGVEGSTITFPAGEFSKQVAIDLKPDGLDFNKQYALPFVFTNPSSGYGVSATSTGVVVQVTVKNAFDGKYTVAIGQSGWAAYGIYVGPPVDYPGTWSFSTAGAATVTTFNDYTGLNLFPGFSADATGAPAATQFGAISPVFTFDANGKITSITNPAADARNRQLVLNPAATASENVFNIADKSFRFNLLFKQNGRPDMNVIMEGEYAGPR